ncbi:hypothetical protein E2C01_076059 [Portunus trituberculatus]|uniref:Uncharacterized protein n=1 Tax=Portunus trituberculatus TaxID=210409 RepID=A0A5B7IGI7_PORTR|nr:hypothetical protein [Portunus trituberculatus]
MRVKAHRGVGVCEWRTHALVWPILYFSASRLIVSRMTIAAFLSSSAAAEALEHRMEYLSGRGSAAVLPQAWQISIPAGVGRRQDCYRGD